MKSSSSSSLHFGSASPSSCIGRALFAQQLAHRNAHGGDKLDAASRGWAAFSDIRSTVGSSPLCRIIASVLRDVPQSGL